jgi:hypothetical protein
MGRRLDHCFGCKYCRELDGESKGFDINTCPTEINRIFDRLPVAINLFHGDPMIQVDHTTVLLRKLHDAQYNGPVIIITKGDFLQYPKYIDFNLDLHFAFSTFGTDSPLDGGSMQQFEANLQEATSRGKHKYSIEFRPIIHGINDTPEIIDQVMALAMKHKLAVGYSGLQGKPGTIEQWDQTTRSLLQPYPGTDLGFKKHVSQEVDDYIRSFGWPVFRKTSCLISYVHGMDRDYNAHYYRPNEMGCTTCPMFLKCRRFKSNMDSFLTVERNVQCELPFSHRVVKKEKHQCPWLHKGCSFPTADCSNLSGWFIDVNPKVTTADVRVIKWLTGLTVCSDFKESSYLSSIWE